MTRRSRVREVKNIGKIKWDGLPDPVGLARQDVSRLLPLIVPRILLYVKCFLVLFLEINISYVVT